jgi:predicted KAP-like P-loop ATPase
MAQLVRAIADFSELSYVLAYDQKRLIEALGYDAPEKRARLERGNAYLEKIVHAQIPLPILLPDELKEFIIRDLRDILISMHDFSEMLASPRFKDLLDILVPDTVKTARDVRRLINYFMIRAPLVDFTVNYVDLLAYSWLEIKSPDLVWEIGRQHERLVFDSVQVTNNQGPLSDQKNV